MQLIFILILIFAVLVAIFAIQNAYPVTIYFLKWQFEASLGLVILICLLIGAVSLGSLSLIHQTKAKLKARAQSKEGEKADQASEGVESGELPAGVKGETPPEILAAGAGEERDTTMNAPGGVDDPSQAVES
ncbi:MAG: LapA family protein [Firmicutes bacterium]|nr:LapA family protein [Bacillota bacterium]